MKEAADRRKELEKQHAEALQQLRQKQMALECALVSAEDKKAYAETIQALQVREISLPLLIEQQQHLTFFA